jgi:hypothetical protein
MLLRVRGKGRGFSVGVRFALHCEMSEPNNGSECNLLAIGNLHLA